MQDKNYALNVIIDQQKSVIKESEEKFIKKFTEMNEYYSSSEQKCVRLEKENSSLK